MEDTVELPNGDLTDYLRFEGWPDCITVVCQNDKGEIALVWDYSYPPDRRLQQLPGGVVKKGEDPLDAAIREVQEEVGMRAAKVTSLGSYLLDHRRSDSRMHAYLMRELEEAPLETDAEEGEMVVAWHSAEEITALIAEAEIENHHTLATWALFVASEHYKD